MPSQRNPKDEVVYLLNEAQKALGTVQGCVYNAERKAKSIKIEPVDRVGIDALVKQIFDELSAAKRCKRSFTQRVTDVITGSKTHRNAVRDAAMPRPTSSVNS